VQAVAQESAGLAKGLGDLLCLAGMGEVAPAAAGEKELRPGLALASTTVVGTPVLAA